MDDLKQRGGATEEDTWTAWAWIWIVAVLLGFAVGLVADAAMNSPDSPARAVFLGIMSGVAFVTVALRQL